MKQLGPGDKAPEEINVVVEIPMGGDPVKYEIDKQTGMVFVDRMLKTSMRYPTNYGYVPQTLADDGDPADVLVVMTLPLVPGCVVRARPIGMLAMRDEAGDDAKIIAVPTSDITGLYRHVNSLDDLGPPIIDQIKHFFAHYKDLETGKWVEIDGWRDADAARDVIARAITAHE